MHPLMKAPPANTWPRFSQARGCCEQRPQPANRRNEGLHSEARPCFSADGCLGMDSVAQLGCIAGTECSHWLADHPSLRRGPQVACVLHPCGGQLRGRPDDGGAPGQHHRHRDWCAPHPLPAPFHLSSCPAGGLIPRTMCAPNIIVLL